MGRRIGPDTLEQKRAQKFVKFTGRLPEQIFALLERQAAAENSDVATVLRRHLEASVEGTPTDTRLLLVERKIDDLLSAHLAFQENTYADGIDRLTTRLVDMLKLQTMAIDEMTKLEDVVINALEVIKSALLTLEQQLKARRT